VGWNPLVERGGDFFVFSLERHRIRKGGNHAISDIEPPITEKGGEGRTSGVSLSALRGKKEEGKPADKNSRLGLVVGGGEKQTHCTKGKKSQCHPAVWEGGGKNHRGRFFCGIFCTETSKTLQK